MEKKQSIDIRLGEHKRACELQSQNSAIVAHAFSNDHGPNWNEAKFIFKSNNVNVRRLVEGAALSLGESFKGNNSFVNEDPFANFYITSKHVFKRF